MPAILSTDAVVPVLQATPEQWAVMEALFAASGGLTGVGMALVVGPGAVRGRAGTLPAGNHEAGTARDEGHSTASAEVKELLVGIHREIAAVRTDYHELRRAKERLETMRAEGLFAFTEKVDAESFKVLCSILAHGDVAKASRALNISDSTVRTRIADWERRGPAYKVLLELVRWRKNIGRRDTVHLSEDLLKATSASTDFAGLISDVLDELLSFDEDNWQEKAEELAGLLRPYVAR